ncbi:MAG: VOC family protein [Amnibacterium sp.]
MLQDVQVNLYTDRLQECLDFYRSLGFAETFRTPQQEPEHVEVRAFSLTIGLSTAAAAKRIIGVDPESETSAAELCFWCDDIEAETRRMLALGATRVRRPDPHADGPAANAWLRDPGGHLLQLVQAS